LVVPGDRSGRSRCLLVKLLDGRGVSKARKNL